MMKSSISLAFCVITLTALSIQARERLDIVDCFDLMPKEVFVDWGFPARVNPERMGEIKSRVRNAVHWEQEWIVVDVRNGYLHYPGDDGGERMGMTMTLFRQPDGGALIAIELRETWEVVELDVRTSHPELKDAVGDVSATSRLRFFDVDRTAWVEVTDRIIPEPLVEGVRYELPRRGTTISLFRRGELKPFRQWLRDGDGFQVVRLR